MTNTNAVSILASLYTYNFCLAINIAHTRLLLSLYFCLFRHLPTIKKLSLEKYKITNKFYTVILLRICLIFNLTVDLHDPLSVLTNRAHKIITVHLFAL